MFDQRCGEIIINVTCSAIWGLLDRDVDLRARHELLNTGVDCLKTSA